jgi:PBP1b-binding outer membrane lipoprotein LpoB
MKFKSIGSCMVAVLLLGGCGGYAIPAPTKPVAAIPPPAAAPAPPPMVTFDQAVLNAGNAVFRTATASGEKRILVIDPLVNGVTGEQSTSTRALGDRLADLARQGYPQFDVQPFTADSVGSAPVVVVGTFTPVNAQFKPTGAREAYRFCLRLADLKSGKIIAQSVARVMPGDVNGTPTPFFADSPAWSSDANIKSYIDTCQTTKIGDPIPPAYIDGIITAAIINQATEAYDAGDYQKALQLYTSARATPAGDQLRIYSGLYLTNVKLGYTDNAVTAFHDIVDYGIRHNRLGVKLLFRPGTTAFVDAQPFNGAYDMWLSQIADEGAKSAVCLQVTGHTSASGSAALNDRLSALRAEYVMGRLEQTTPVLHGRIVAVGAGAKANLIGTGTDDASDMLDRRVEFEVIPACT